LRPTSSTDTPIDTPLRATADGVRIGVRLTPRARADRIDGIAHLADGAALLKVTVTAPPADGRANDALLQLLAKEWRVPRRDLAIVGGQKSRNKIVHIAGDPALLLKRLGDAVAALPES
jgi:uncharacterized protein (TIGR00251 family)